MSETRLFRIPADLKNLSLIRQLVEDAAAGQAVDPSHIADMLQAVDEAATNIMIHAYRRGPGIIEVEIELNGEWLVVRMRDDGPPFDPTTYPPPDLTVPLEKRRLGGLGIHLMRHLTDRMTYRRTTDGTNELTLARRAVPTEQ